MSRVPDNARPPGTTIREPHTLWYDRLHHRKAYPAEVDQIREILLREGSADEILDLACGTARHLEFLAAAGYRVTGVDRSPTMVAAARARLAPYGIRHRVLEADGRRMAAGHRVDAVLMMFGLLSYQVDNDQALALLDSARRQLRPGGLVVFDVLDAMTALTGPPANGGLVVIPVDGQELLCAHTERLRAESQLLELSLRFWLLSDGRLVDQEEELHPLRFFLDRELDLLLRLAGFVFLGSTPLAGEDVLAGQETFRLVWARRV
jgi:SAM-dependent methyltransferase